MSGPDAAILRIRNLRTHFSTFDGLVRAVDGVDLTLRAGETFGLVGESGCGKSVTAMSVLRLIRPPQGRIVGGEIRFLDQDLLALKKQQIRRLRGDQIAMIFQEPMTSLNPVFTVGRQVSETLMAHRNVSRKEARDEAVGLLERVGIPSPAHRAGDYPHQLSGGMRQRVMIAMAMACRPKLLIADEPTTALDVTIQAQILDLIQEIKEETGMSVLLITHNFGVIMETAQKTAVMYAGQVVEEASTDRLLSHPTHPYTQGLLRSVPQIGSKVQGGRQKLYEIKGIVPRLTEEPRGCHFAPRCRLRLPECFNLRPELREIDDDHRVRCLPDRDVAGGVQ
jgi:oligopeptide/dipeptide ABC transporter ATP-binding protein